MCLKLDTEPLQGLENVLETDLAQMQKPQPVNPELPSWPVSAFLHMQNNFSVNNVLSRTATVHHAILDDHSHVTRTATFSLQPLTVQPCPHRVGAVTSELVSGETADLRVPRTPGPQPFKGPGTPHSCCMLTILQGSRPSLTLGWTCVSRPPDVGCWHGPS